jgi:purine-binding chemotaxis protein CheW
MHAAVAEHLSFSLAGETFALRIDAVREVLGLIELTKIPRTPEYMRGAINLRGQAVPVMDLRARFGMCPTEDTEDTCIVIVEIDCAGERAIMGGLVDAVREVVELPEAALEAAPRMGTPIDPAFIRGMARRDGGFIVAIDLDRVFSAEEMRRTYRRAEGCPEPGPGKGS